MILKRWFARIGAGLFLLAALGFIVAAVLNYRVGRKLEQKRAAVRAAGWPLTFAELVFLEVDEDQDAASALGMMRVELDAIEKECAVFYVDANLGKYYQNEKLTKEGAAFLREVFTRHPTLVAKIHQAAERKLYRPNPDLTIPASELLQKQLDHLGGLRKPARVLGYHADWLLYEGRREEAARNGLMALQLSFHFEKEPFVISHLVTLAVRAMGFAILKRSLEGGPLPEPTRKEIDTTLARCEDTRGQVYALQSEQVLGVANFHEQLGFPNRSMWWFMQDQCDYMDLMATRIRLASQPYYLASKELDKLKEQSKQWGPLTRLVYPALEVSQAANDRTLAKARCLRLLNAVQAYTLEKGAPPTDWNVLSVPVDVSTDPFTGKPLLVKKSKDEWTIYSVGSDLSDDRGELHKDRDFGIGPVLITSRSLQGK